MSKLVKLATSAGLSVASLGLMASSAFASTSIINTGDCFHFNGNTSTITRVNVTNNNTAIVRQSAFTLANTGGNTLSKNIFGGSIDTGNINVSNRFNVSANSNWTSISLGN